MATWIRWPLTAPLRRRLEDGRLKHTDAVKNAFDRLLKMTGLQDSGKGFYRLRKTGASLIERIDPAVTEMHLSHAEPGMERAYAERDWARLGRALARLGERLAGMLCSRATAVAKWEDEDQ